MNTILCMVLVSMLITMSYSDPPGPGYYGDNSPYSYPSRGKFWLCVKDMKWGETGTNEIETRLTYKDSSNDYAFSTWELLGPRFGVETKGTCVEITNFVGSIYAQKTWTHIDLHTCSNDGLAIDKIKYWDEPSKSVKTVPSLTESAFNSIKCVKSDHIWLKGSADCYALSVNIQTGEVLMNPWMTGSGQQCTKYEAHNNPLSLIEDDDGGMRIGIDENMMIFGGILVILIVISTCYSVYLCNTKYNKQYKMVRVYSDTDQENVQ